MEREPKPKYKQETLPEFVERKEREEREEQEMEEWLKRTAAHGIRILPEKDLAPKEKKIYERLQIKELTKQKEKRREDLLKVLAHIDSSTSKCYSELDKLLGGIFEGKLKVILKKIKAGIVDREKIRGIKNKIEDLEKEGKGVEKELIKIYQAKGVSLKEIPAAIWMDKMPYYLPLIEKGKKEKKEEMKEK